MTRGAYTLSDLPPGDVGLTCAACGRSASYPRDHLIVDMGEDTSLPDALRALTSLWCRGERAWMDSPCRARWDALPATQSVSQT